MPSIPGVSSRATSSSRPAPAPAGIPARKAARSKPSSPGPSTPSPAQGPSLIRSHAKPVHLVLQKNLNKTVRSGHPWLYADALVQVPKDVAPGSLALVKTKTGDILSKGYVDPGSALAYRSLAVGREVLDGSLIASRLERAVSLRSRLFPDPSLTSGYRLINGEGDGLPGLHCDVYDSVAVMKLDGQGPQGFYDEQAIAEWLLRRYSGQLRTVYLKYKAGKGGNGFEDEDDDQEEEEQGPAGQQQGGQRQKQQQRQGPGKQQGQQQQQRGRVLAGEPPVAGQPTVFAENGVRFQVDVVVGQKTGFFLDQRDNRAFIGRLCTTHTTSAGSSSSSSSGPSGPRVLNMFGYTGGFSCYAGRGGASHVTTVDVAEAAIASAAANWELNGLDSRRHEGVASDASAFLDQALKEGRSWDIVIVDPPSYAPNKQSVDRARAKYEDLFSQAARVTAPNGILALASCSSHIPASMFSEICGEALWRGKRRGYLLREAGAPEDHPVPGAAPELRYLKFLAYQLEG